MEGGHVDWMDECVGRRIGRAMAKVGVSRADLALSLGMSDRWIADRMSAPASFELGELILLAAALDHEVLDLLPDAQCSLWRGCEVCRTER